jgi:voltage-gated potassium channel
MNRKKGGDWLRYKRDTYRYGLYNRRLPLVLFLNVTMVILLGSLLLEIFEKGINPGINNYWDAAWCMFVSMATIGYGDIVPITVAGRIVVLISMVLGIGALSTYITTLATRRVAKTKRRYSGLQGKTKSSNHVIVCGWNSRGAHVVEKLGAELAGQYRPIVLLADLEEKPVEDEGVFFFRGSPASETDLRRANIAEAASAILLADEAKGGTAEDIDSRTVLTALTIRALSPTVKMTAEILRPENINHLKLADVDEILDSDMVLGNLIARSALHSGLISIVTEMVAGKENMHIFSRPVGEDMAGKTNDDVVSILRERGGGKLIGTITSAGFISYDQPYTIKRDDHLLMLAEEEPDIDDT